MVKPMSALIDRLAAHLAATLPAPGARVPADGMRRAAVAALLYDADDATGVRVLLMRRTERATDPWSGHVALPGGRHEPSDADLLATAIRETREELGVELRGVRVLGCLPALTPRISGPTGIEVTPFVFVTETAVEAKTGPEAAAVFWLPLALAAGGTLDGTFVHTTGMAFPSWDYSGHTIWGLTLRILGSIVELAK
jgi:8-oxo-dGTP pyrophosphatase MutT (NUDIX family)